MRAAAAVTLWAVASSLLSVSRGFLQQRPFVCRNPLLSSKIVLDKQETLEPQLLQRISTLVHKRAVARHLGDYILADAIREEIDRIDVGQTEIVIKDTARSNGGGSSWEVVGAIPDWNGPSVLNLAHQALGLAVSCSERALSVPQDQLQDLVVSAKKQLVVWNETRLGKRYKNALTQNELEHSMEQLQIWNSVDTQLCGRKPADAAFWFAIAGVTDKEIFDLLTSVAIKEFERIGSSCQSKDIMAISDRLAAAGIHEQPMLEEMVRRHLPKLEDDSTLNRQILSLHSDSCAQMVWQFSTKQKKQKSFLSTAAKHWVGIGGHHIGPDDVVNLNKLFADPGRPLVIDIGCGMGVCLLGLARLQNSENGFHWHRCNYLGVDLNPLAIGYASSIAQRWGVNERLAFVHNSASNILQQASSYNGSVKRILVQFPTPYRLPASSDGKNSEQTGNSQLPESVKSGFMVSANLLKLAEGLLRASNGELLVQSNCEDVAVWIRNTAREQAKFSLQVVTDEVELGSSNPTQRTQKWIQMNGERAIGAGWSAIPLLPRTGRTETEIACIANGTPVHRCILRAC